MGIIAYWVRAELRQRWTTWTAIAVIVGVGGGLVIGVIAGARRTHTAYPRFLAAANAPDLVVDPDFEADSSDFLADLASVDGVDRKTDARAMTIGRVVDGVVDAGTLGSAIASVDGDRYYTHDRVKVLDGRLPAPDRADEILVNDVVAARGVAVGDVLDFRAFTTEQFFGAFEGGAAEIPAEAGVPLRLEVTGIGVFPEIALVEDEYAQTRIMLTPALHRSLDPDTWLWDRAGIHLAPGADLDQVRREVQELARRAGGSTAFEERDKITGRAQRSVRPYVLALAGLGAAGAVFVLLLATQLVRRASLQSSDQRQVLSALAIPRSTRWSITVAVPAIAAVASLGVAVSTAMAVSTRFPVGPVRRLEHEAGAAFDSVVVGPAMIVLVLSVVLPALRVDRVARATADTDRLGTLARHAGAPLAVVLGVGRAVGVGSPVRRASARAGLASVALATAMIVAVTVFGASVKQLLDRPELHGWNVDAVLVGADGYGTLDFAAMSEVPGVESLTASVFANITIDGLDVAGAGQIPVRGSLLPPLVSGRHAAAPGEIVVGSSTLDALGAELGDRVEVTLPGDEPAPMTLVGTVVFPGLGRLDNDRPTLGDGAMVTLPLDSVEEIDQGWSVVAVTFAEGIDRSRTLDALVAASQEPTGEVAVHDVIRPMDIAAFARLGSVPLLIVTVLVALALGSVGHLLHVSGRNWRHERAVLAAMGASPQTLRATARWQAVAVVVLSAAVAVPGGLVLGRWSWRSLANEIGVVPTPTVPVSLIAATVVVLAVVAVLAAVPMERAARAIRPGDGLRAE